MKVKELIEILSQLNQENELVIKDNNSKSTIWPTPIFNLDSVFQWFDWDTWKTFLFFNDIWNNSKENK